MKKKIYILTLLFCLIVGLVGCSITRVPIDREHVDAYFDNRELPEGVEMIYLDDTDGNAYLRRINDNASSKLMTSWYCLGDFSKLKGQFNGVWCYGYGTENELLLVHGQDKDAVYEVMDDYTASVVDKE